MSIYIGEQDGYISYFVQKEQESKGNDSRVGLAAASDAAIDQLGKSDSSKNGEIGLRAMDRVDISAEARELQRVLGGEKYDPQNQQETLGQNARSSQSALHNLAAGKKDEKAESVLDNSKLLAFSEATRMLSTTPEDDTNINEELRELKKQMQEAMNRLTQAQSKLAEAQADAKSGNADVTELADPSAKVQAAQQEISACSAEVAEIQQQIQSILSEQSSGGSSGDKGGAGIQAVAGRTWSPQGTTDFKVGG